MIIPYRGARYKGGKRMAQYDRHLTGSFGEMLNLIDDSVMQGSISATREGGSDHSMGDIRCSVRVYERYSAMGSNRLSLNITLFGRDGDIQLTAVASGGSQGMFFKFNTIGEEAFLNKLVREIERHCT